MEGLGCNYNQRKVIQVGIIYSLGIVVAPNVEKSHLWAESAEHCRPELALVQ